MAGRHPESFDGAMLSALAEHAFGRHATATGDGLELGWIRPTHLFDTDFSSESGVTVGRFTYVALRVDRTGAPPAIVRSYRMMEEAARLADSGREFLTRSQKKEAKEAALARAEQEAKEGVFRRVSATPLLIDWADGAAYFGSTSASAADRLTTLCADTFDISLVPAHSEEVAFRIAQRLGLLSAFEESAPEYVAPPPQGAAGFDTGALDAHDRTYLGREFLTYLWNLRDDAEGLCPIGGGKEVEFVLHKSLSLECERGVTGRLSIRADAPATSAEARAALASGKQPTKLSLLAVIGGEEASFTLDGRQFTVSGLALPRSDEKDAAAALEERFMTLRLVADTLDAMYAEFLRLRLGNGWSRTWSGVRAWAMREVASDVRGPQRASA
ncbi:MAG: hypothetical protein BroJett003_16450 [Planctomycetota bacterium]|nr:MAG: hypothetical protein BroJett003_16450 [Planctomycetota bacterium]